VKLRRLSVPVFLAGAALVLVPWTVWLAASLPSRYLSRHLGVGWAGVDAALATTLALTAVAALRRAPWLDRAAVAAATLLAADAWFDVVTPAATPRSHSPRSKQSPSNCRSRCSASGS
jgi:hypothetical protein